MDIPTRMAVATHEAGHAVMRMINADAPVIAGISLNPRNGELGQVDTQPMWHPGHMDRMAPDPLSAAEWRRLAHRDVVFYLAGPIAELRSTGYSRHQVQFGVGQMMDRCLGPDAPTYRSDLDEVARRLRWCSPGEERSAFLAAWFVTEATVARWMDAIRALARWLHDADELGEDQIDHFRATNVAPHLGKLGEVHGP